MTLDRFIEQWDGKFCEVAGSANAKNQCVDLANAYIRDVLGFPIIEWTNAVDFPSKGGSNFEYIVNTPDGVPEKGDLVIWGGDVGHIAIFLEGDANRFTSFDQNYPTGSPCKRVSHTYLRPKVIGWMRPKTTNMQQELDKCRLSRDSHHQDLMKIKDGLMVVGEYSIDNILNRIDSLNRSERQLGEKEKQLTQVQSELSDISGQLKTKLEDYNKLKLDHDSLGGKIDELGIALREANNTIEKLKTQSNPGELTGLQLIVKGIIKIFVK